MVAPKKVSYCPGTKHLIKFAVLPSSCANTVNKPSIVPYFCTNWLQQKSANTIPTSNLRKLISPNIPRQPKKSRAKAKNNPKRRVLRINMW